jgi:hypothetical protein
MTSTLPMTTPALMTVTATGKAKSERSDLLLIPGYYGHDYAFDPTSLNGYDSDRVGWQDLNVQARLCDYGYGYHLGFDHTS